MTVNFIFLVLASVLVLESLILFTSPSGIKKIIKEILTIPDLTLRIFSLIFIIIGLIVIFLLKDKICI